MLRIWYWEHCPEGITIETFLRKVKKWEHAGFISNDVWSKLDVIVDSETIQTSLSASIHDGFEKLCEDEIVTERVLSCVSRNIVSSRILLFALEMLRLAYHQYEQASSHGEEMRTSLEVCRK